MPLSASVLLSNYGGVSVHDKSNDKEFVTRRDPAIARYSPLEKVVWSVLIDVLGVRSGLSCH